VDGASKLANRPLEKASLIQELYRWQDRRRNILMAQHPGQWNREPNSALKDLAFLVGEWTMVGTHPGFESPVHGRSTFRWLENEALLLWHFAWEQPGPPNAVQVIGHDDSSEAHYTVLYSDERGVTRIYYMSVQGRVWKMHRESAGFSQRMTGTIGDDGRTITVAGELSRDGSNWRPDLNIIYSKYPPT
jgi:hypothetical protein